MPPRNRPGMADQTTAGQGGPAPLAGIRILDLTAVVVGPACTQRLAQYGADIIKVEPPGGDVFRRVAGPSPTGEHGGAYLHLNRNKRAICLDLKQPAARAALLRVADRCDVLVANMRPDALARLGLDAATLRATRPGLVHCLITGFGPGGPYRGKPAYDAIIQSLAGITGLFERRDGAPAFAPLLLCDRITGEIAASAIAAALAGRSRHGAGAAIEVPMFETMAAFVLQEHLGPASFDPALGPVGDSRTLDPGQQPMRTADGWLSVSATNDKQAAAFLRAAGRPDLAHDPRFCTAAGRYRDVAAWTALRAALLATRTTADWMEALSAADVPASPCTALDDLPTDPHLAAAGLLGTEPHPTEGAIRAIRSPILFDGAPPPNGPPAAPRGADTRAVLAEAGLDPGEIADLLASGAAFG